MARMAHLTKAIVFSLETHAHLSLRFFFLGDNLYPI